MYSKSEKYLYSTMQNKFTLLGISDFIENLYVYNIIMYFSLNESLFDKNKLNFQRFIFLKNVMWMLAKMSFAIDSHIISLFLRNMSHVGRKEERTKNKIRKRAKRKHQAINTKSTIGFVRFLTQISLKNLEGKGSVFH